MPVDPRYLEDASGYTGRADHVWLPGSCEEVARILGQAAEAGIPVTVAGAGTGVTGGRVAQGGWVISMEKLLGLAILDGRAVAGAGVALRDLAVAAQGTRQLYPPDPTEWTASVGGTIATNASGSRSFRYGATRAWIETLTVALMDGSVRRYARGDRVDFEIPAVRLPRTTKNTAGYPLAPGMDWIDLFTGSEGTLGVVCEAELRLIPAPRALVSGVIFFGTETGAVEAADAWRGVEGLRMIEYFDRGSLQMLRTRFPEAPATSGSALLIEQEADPSVEVDRWADRVVDARADPAQSWFAASAADRERFRAFRHALPEMVNDTVRRNGFQKLGSDYAVPVDCNADMLAIYR